MNTPANVKIEVQQMTSVLGGTQVAGSNNVIDLARNELRECKIGMLVKPKVVVQDPKANRR